MELPARGDGDVVTVDAERVDATRTGDYWVVDREITGTVLFEVR